MVSNTGEQLNKGRGKDCWVEVTMCMYVWDKGRDMRGSLIVPTQTLQPTDPETSDTSTERQSTNCTRPFAIIEDDRLHEGLNCLMVKMRRKDGGRE